MFQKEKPFTWGEPVTTWFIGPYTIMEYHPWKRVDGITSDHTQSDQTKKMYHGWVNGRDTCWGSTDLDAMVAHLIAYKNDGINTRADIYFIRSVKKDNGEPRRHD